MACRSDHRTWYRQWACAVTRGWRGTEVPGAIAETLELGRRGILSDNAILGLLLLALALTAAVVHIELARRQLLVEFPRRPVGVRMIESRARLQLKLNNAGIISVILASWLALLVFWAVTYFAGEGPDSIASNLQMGRPGYLVLYGAAIAGFTFFYAAFLLDPDEIAEDLKRHAG